MSSNVKNRRALIIGASAVTAAAVLALGATMVANATAPASSAGLSAAAATPESGATGNGAPPAGAPPQGAQGDASHGAAGETVLTGDDAAKAKAAALEAVPGATVVRVETDSGSAKYEAHVTTSDGTAKTVKLDAAFKVVAVQDGMGQGPAGKPQDSTTSSGA